MKKSKGERQVESLIMRTLNCEYIWNGYYSHIRSPKGYPMQYDYLVFEFVRGAMKPLFAIEYQGEQHSQPVYGNAKFIKQQGRDKKKQEKSNQSGIQIIYFYHNEEINVDTLFSKLRAHGLLKRLMVRNLISERYITIAKSFFKLD